MKPLATVTVVVSRLVTTMFAAPAPAGVVKVSEPPVISVTFVAALPPTVTVTPVWKPLPLSVTVVPPAAGPDVGSTRVTVGLGAGPFR